MFTAPLIRLRIDRLRRCITDLEAFDPATVQSRDDDPQVIGLEAGIQSALADAFGNGTPAFARFLDAANLDNGPRIMRMEPSWITARHGGGYSSGPNPQEFQAYFAEGKKRSIVLLQEAVRVLEAKLEDLNVEEAPTAGIAASPALARKVFVVHGHDEAALQSMARFLEHLELEPIILKEQPDQGLTIIEKFVAYAGQASFAIVLLTPDDLGGATAAATQQERARQNVIFELGFFVGQLGRGKVCLVRKGDVEMPSDLSGVIYKELDAGEGWKLKLGQELKAAGLAFDANKLWS